MSRFDALKESVLVDGVIAARGVEKLREELYADGGIDRDEADFLFELNDAARGKANHSSWRPLFVEAITAHLLNDQESPGGIHEAEARWLRAWKCDVVYARRHPGRLSRSPFLKRRSSWRMVNQSIYILRGGSNTMSKLDALKQSILADGVIDAQEVEALRKELYADGVIDRDEADFLFELNDATSGKANHSSWKALFVEAITAHVLGDDESPGAVDEAEAGWLIAHIEKDGVLDENENALLANIKAKAKSVAPKLAKFGQP